MFLRFSRCVIKNKVLSDVYVPINTSIKYIALDQTRNMEKIIVNYVNNENLEINKHYEWDTYEIFEKVQKALEDKYKVVDVSTYDKTIGS